MALFEEVPERTRMGAGTVVPFLVCLGMCLIGFSKNVLRKRVNKIYILYGKV